MKDVSAFRDHIALMDVRMQQLSDRIGQKTDGSKAGTDRDEGEGSEGWGDLMSGMGGFSMGRDGDLAELQQLRCGICLNQFEGYASDWLHICQDCEAKK